MNESMGDCYKWIVNDGLTCLINESNVFVSFLIQDPFDLFLHFNRTHPHRKKSILLLPLAIY